MSKWKELEASSACKEKVGKEIEEESRKDNSGIKKSRSTRGKTRNMGICNGKGLVGC
jgi:hypothetical protein